MFRKFTIAKRIYALFAIMTLFLAGMAGGLYGVADHIAEAGIATAKDSMLAAEKNRIQALTHSLAVSLGDLSAGLGEEEQRQVIAKGIERVRFDADQSGYFYVYKGTVNAAHPVQKQLVGKDLGEAKDREGLLYVRELARVASAGGGFVTFVFPKPGMGDQPKLGYAESIPGTPFWVGTGIYLDNIRAAEAGVAGSMDQVRTREVLYTYAVVLGLLLFVGLPVAYLLARSIVLPLREATRTAQDIAAGDLDRHIAVEGADEVSALQSALDVMVRTLRGNLERMGAQQEEARRLAESASEAARNADEQARAALASREGMLEAAVRLGRMTEDLGVSARELASRSATLSDGSHSQTARVAETATAMEQMNASVMDVARSAADAARETEASRERARQGADAVTATMDAMSELRGLAETLHENMRKLGGQSEAIGSVMGVINDIADQTNLLALNAAIEAARAGDAGRGFAVVADEVRKLAEKTMTATREVGETIKGIQALTEANARSMDDSLRAMELAERRSADSGEVLRGILDMAVRVTGQVQAIAAAAEEQSAASEQITRSLAQVDEIARHNGRLVTEEDKEIRDLGRMAEDLRGLVAELQRKAG
jgi:methyl-accepting chemotaxis protein